MKDMLASLPQMREVKEKVRSQLLSVLASLADAVRL